MQCFDLFPSASNTSWNKCPTSSQWSQPAAAPTYPVEIIDVIDDFYFGIIPDPVVIFLKVALIIGLAFVILSVILKRDV